MVVGSPGSGVAEDRLTPSAAPAHTRLPLDRNPLEGGPTIRPGELPGHRPHAGCTVGSLYPERPWPRCRRIGVSSLAGGMELPPNNRPEHRTLLARELCPVTLERRHELELQRVGALRLRTSATCRGARRANRDPRRPPPGRRPRAHRPPFHRLPPLRTEPALLGRHWQDRAQLDPSVLLFDDLDLSPGLVEVEPPAKVDGQRDRSARLKCHEVRLHATRHGSNAALVKTARRTTRYSRAPPVAAAVCGPRAGRAARGAPRDPPLGVKRRRILNARRGSRRSTAFRVSLFRPTRSSTRACCRPRASRRSSRSTRAHPCRSS